MELVRWGKVKRGDIIVFRFPKDPDLDFVKRVVAIGGDRIQIIDDRIFLNDEKIERSNNLVDRSILSDVGDRADIKDLYVESIGRDLFL